MAQIVTFARPSRLFRYRVSDAVDIDRELQAIEEKYIYCASYSSLNDPMEGGHRLSAVFKSHKAQKSRRLAVTEQIGQMGIASFSETKSHELMWAHYSNEFAGICISYNTMKLLSGLSKSNDLVKMNYSDEPPIMLNNNETAMRRAKLALSYKTLRWSTEREWRLFAPTQGPEYYKYTNTVAAIYVGMRTPQEIRDQVLCRARNLSIPVYLMGINKYDLKFKLVRMRRTLKKPTKKVKQLGQN